MNILITGSEGQLGNELLRCLETKRAEMGPIPSLYENANWDAVDREALDISDPSAVATWFSEHTYDLVINCAAITNVDGCERDEKLAYRVNALGPESLARAAAGQNAKLVQVSTDYVFPGNLEGDRVEDDETGPISAYGRTKFAGEELALAANPRTFVCRTAWLYGYTGKNFVKTMLNLGKKLESVSVVCDQMGNPTSANDLAYAILLVAATDEYGIYHMTNEGTCSWADFAEQIMEKSRTNCSVERVTSAQYKAANPQSADRPRYSSLRNKHLEDTIGNPFRPWKEALNEYLSHLGLA